MSHINILELRHKCYFCGKMGALVDSWVQAFKRVVPGLPIDPCFASLWLLWWFSLMVSVGGSATALNPNTMLHPNAGSAFRIDSPRLRLSHLTGIAEGRGGMMISDGLLRKR